MPTSKQACQFLRAGLSNYPGEKGGEGEQAGDPSDTRGCWLGYSEKVVSSFSEGREGGFWDGMGWGVLIWEGRVCNIEVYAQ